MAEEETHFFLPTQPRCPPKPPVADGGSWLFFQRAPGAVASTTQNKHHNPPRHENPSTARRPGSPGPRTGPPLPNNNPGPPPPASGTTVPQGKNLPTLEKKLPYKTLAAFTTKTKPDRPFPPLETTGLAPLGPPPTPLHTFPPPPPGWRPPPLLVRAPRNTRPGPMPPEPPPPDPCQGVKKVPPQSPNNNPLPGPAAEVGVSAGPCPRPVG